MAEPPLEPIEPRFKQYGEYDKDEMIRDLLLLVEELNKRLVLIQQRLAALEPP